MKRFIINRYLRLVLAGLIAFCGAALADAESLLENPTIRTVSPRAGAVKLYWDAADPAENVKHYWVFVSESDFSSIEGLTPSTTTTSLSAVISGLNNELTYYFAVTAVNISDDESALVETVSASPVGGTNVSGDITSDTRWTPAGSPYIVTGDITVRYDRPTYGSHFATLTIESGVEVRFEPGTGLYIGKEYRSDHYDYYGALTARGTAASPITFTSSAAAPAPGDWKGIRFQNQTIDADSLLEHCVVEYAGLANNANIYFAGAQPPVKYSTIRHGSAHGLYLAASSPILAENTISANAQDGIHLADASPVISDNDITANGANGIYSDDISAAQIENNVISNNGQGAISGIHPNQLQKLSGNSGSGNGLNYIRVGGGEITASGTWAKQDFAYVVTGDITVRHASTSYGSHFATLTIDPGVEVRFEPGTGLIIGKEYRSDHFDYYGGLTAQGTALLPITFTSNAAAPAPGDWKGIRFQDPTNDNGALLEHCVVEYAGLANNANIYIADADPTIRNTTIRHSSAAGLYLAGSSAILAENTIAANSNDGIRLTDSSPTVSENHITANGANGVELSNSSLDLTANTISANAGSGVKSDSSSALLIKDNVIKDNTQGAIMGIHPNWVKNLSGNDISGNGKNYILVHGGDITASGTWVKQGLAYVVTGDITVRHAGLSWGSLFATLTIDSGVEVRFEPGTGLYIGKDYRSDHYDYYGALTARGTAALPITFTSNAPVPAPGDWKGIRFQNQTIDAASRLEHCVVEYAGMANNANIYLSGAEPPVKNSIIRHGSAHGFYLTASSPILAENTISANAQDGIHLADSSPVIADNDVTANGANGIHSDDVSAAQIENNVISNNGQGAISGIHPNQIQKLIGNSGSGNGLDYIQVRGGEITASGTWVKQGFAYVVNGDITVRYASPSYGNNIATLTIDPGVAVRFAPGTGLIIGKEYRSDHFDYYGGLTAQGTATLPITFTSNAAAPAPGNWKGIRFQDPTNDAGTLLEHCVVEYAGLAGNANIYFSDANPTLQYNTIRNSSHSGVYVDGADSSGAVIRCNNLKDNHYGVYISGNAVPLVKANNFLRNKNYGVNAAATATVDVTDNWWGDVNGPNFNGDHVNGPLAFTPWLTEESDCILSPPTNAAPFVPQNPDPGNGAVRVPVLVEGQPVAVTLGWTGGDPNPWDTVVYDLYFGTAEDSLVKAAESIAETFYEKAGLAAGTTYFWQIVTRDDTGAESTGAVWHFTTLGDPPDLIVSDVAWQPGSDLQAGQTIAFSATVENTGNGPVVDAFQVAFYIDGQSIAAKTFNPVINSGASLLISHTWTAAAGDHAIEVQVDSQQQVAEMHEDNNSFSAALPYIGDPTPPDLIGSVPAHGTAVKQADTIVFTLSDQFGVVDTAAVVASVAVSNAGGQTIAGTVTAANDKFTFTPDTLTLADGQYTVTFTARDLAGNTQQYSFTFTVDGQPPAAPVIIGDSVLSGPIGVRPAQNKAKRSDVTLTGTRENESGVYINNQLAVDYGSGDWSKDLNLSQGDNTLEIWLQDAAGNRGPSVWVDIRVDSVAPEVTAILPANNSFIKEVPPTVSITCVEASSSLNLANSILAIIDGDQSPVPGTWTPSGAEKLVFTPAAPLTDATYVVDVQIEDDFTNRSTPAQYIFTVDTTPPAAPSIDAYATPTHNPAQKVTGTKEAYSALWLNNEQIVGHTAEASWEAFVNLSSGSNLFEFVVEDRAGNHSPPATIDIFYDDIPPPPVDTLIAVGDGDGHTVHLDWTGYDESMHGDIEAYRIYVSSSSFTDLAGLTPRTTGDAGIDSYAVQGLERNTTYWLAVVAVDRMGNANGTAVPVSAKTRDIEPPEDVQNLKVACFADRLTFTWNHSADTDGDLAAYRVAFGTDQTGELLPASQSIYDKTGLAAATAHDFVIYSEDNDGNQSGGIQITGVTLLANPANLAAEPHSGYVSLTWDGAAPSEYVKQYTVYVGEAEFTTVNGLTPVISTGATQANIAGLTNHTQYYFAVTTVNISDGEDPTVTSVAATPVPDTEGPVITNLTVNNVALLDGQILTAPATFSCAAADPAGVSRLELSIDGNLLRTDYNAPYTAFWNIVAVEDREYTLLINAYDTLGNRSSLEVRLIVALEPPAEAPQISQPQDGSQTNQTSIRTAGSTDKYSDVTIYLNDPETGIPALVDIQGQFSTNINLVEGENRIRAAAVNRAGEGPKSSEIRITLDTTLPVPPLNLTAQAQPGGVVNVTWQKATGAAAAGYNLYRADQPFDLAASASRINAGLITGTSFSDLTPADGTWYYRASAVDSAGNDSGLSADASATADSTAPRVVSIAYNPQGAFDSATGTMAPGSVLLEVTVSEPLQTAPFFSINPQGGMPLSVELAKDTDLTYTGMFAIATTMPSGTAYVVFSGRDLVGNRGTDIDNGGSIQIDTTGPAVSRLFVSPPEPIQNDEQHPVTLTAILGLNEAVKAGSAPQLSYLLSNGGRQPVAVESLTELTPQGDDVATWQAEFTLPADAGLAGPETFYFIYHGTDALDNTGSRILVDNLFQVYQGELPPLETPANLAGQSLPAGKIRLSWNAVADAVGYQLYRRAPGEDQLTAYQRLDLVETYVDEPAVDGDYTYAVASIRRENDQDALSGMSAPVTLGSDSTAPGAPQNLVLELLAGGIKAAWQPPEVFETVTYSIYRAPASTIISVDGLTPLKTGIAETEALDSTPSPSDHCYVVTAEDKAGNESPPSNSFYLNFELLPVASLKVVQKDDNPPLVTWTHPGGSTIGYDIYLGRGESKIRLNPEFLTKTAFADSGYGDDERVYTVVARDGTDESLGRSITLPMVQATLAEESHISRGLMNRLEYSVANSSTVPVEHLRLKADIAGYKHTSAEFSVAGNFARKIDVIVGGYAELADEETITLTVEIIPAEGELVEIIRSGQLAVGDGMLAVDILNEEFTRGATGRLRFTLENTGEEDIEIVTATGFGTAPSNEIFVNLLDDEGYLLSSTPFKQTTGMDCQAGPCVARIPAGATFTSAPVTISVPFGAPDQVLVELEFAAIHYRLGQPEAVTMPGMVTKREVVLAETTYFGEVLDVSPPSSIGDEDIVITGRAVERDSGRPLQDVPLNLVIFTDGFERRNPVFTDAEGNFSYTFTPLPGESGTYHVWAVHPEIQDRPDQGQFVINRLSVKPDIVDLSVPRNYEQTVNLQVTAGKDTTVKNLHLVYGELDQVGGVYPQGVTLMPGAPVPVLSSGQSAVLTCRLSADNTADEIGQVVLKVKSDETGMQAWQTVFINTQFTVARPVLAASPHFVETGVVRGEAVTENLVLKNKGLADLYALKLSVVDAGDNPAPAWVQLGSSTESGTLAIGESREVNLTFVPTEDVAEGDYTYYLKVSGDNYPAAKISLHAAVRREGLGNALIKVIDIYTGTTDAAGEIIQGVAGVRVELQNEDVQSIHYAETTNELGEVEIFGIPAGRYYCRITSGRHSDYSGHLWIKPGITATEEITLLYRAVSVEWNVSETAIADKYEIDLTATYETNVPAPVIIAEPLSTTLPVMLAGDVYTGEFTLTNYGLARGVFYGISLPENSENYTYELLSGLPAALEAKERITVPFRVTCLKSADGSDGSATGGGSGDGSGAIEFPYHTSCAGGKAVHFIRPPAGGDPATYRKFIGSSLGEGLAGYGPSSKKLSGTRCIPKALRKENDKLAESCALPETDQNQNQATGSFVHAVLGEYGRDKVDLSIKAPGGSIEIHRYYYDNKWHWDHRRHNLIFMRDAIGHVDSIDKAGVIYNAGAMPFNPLSKAAYLPEVYVFKNATNTITVRSGVDGEGFRWENKSGSWREYDNDGRMISYGTRGGVLAKMIYEPGEGGKLIGLTDRNDRQVYWYEYEGDLVSAVRDIENRRLEYSYTDKLLTGITDVTDGITRYEYDDNSRITKVVDAENHERNISYDEYGYVESVVDNEGKGHFFGWDYDPAKSEYYTRIGFSSGKIKEIWYDVEGDTKRVAINGRTMQKITKDGRSLIIDDGIGNFTRKEYDEWDNLTRKIYPDGTSVAYKYEHTFNRMVEEIDENGVTTAYGYDESGNMIRKTEAAGTADERVTEYTYDDDNNLLTTRRLADSVTAEALTVTAYDELGNLISVTDPENNTTRFTAHGIMGNVLTRIDARGKEWTYEYDAAGRITTMIDPIVNDTEPLRNVTRIDYDGLGNKVLEVDPLGRETRYEYDNNGNLSAVTDHLGHATRYEYNDDNRLELQVDAEGRTIRYEYDIDGRLINTIDGNGNEIVREFDDNSGSSGCSSCNGAAGTNQPARIIYPTFEKHLSHDKRGRKLAEVDVLNETESYIVLQGYDDVGNLVSRIDQEQKSTTYGYDHLNRLVRVTDAMIKDTLYTYDNRDNLIALTDAEGNTTRFEYDRHNRLVKEIRPEGQQTVYDYDGAGNLIEKIDAKNQKTEYIYDDAGRLEKIRYYEPENHSDPVKTVVFTYDQSGNLTGYDDGFTSAVYAYDDLYRKQSETVNYGTFELTNSYTYYKNGLKKTFTGPDGVTYTYTYDDNNQLTGVNIPGAGYITYSAYQWNRPTEVILPGGGKREYAYDPLMRVKSIAAKDPAQNIMLNYQYDYDKVDNITAKVTEHGDYGYGYDDLYRLTDADNPGQTDEGFSYDAVGNRLTSAVVSGDWGYNDNNELQGYADTTFEYDDNGNMTQKTDAGLVTNYIYNVEDRLERVGDGSGSLISSYYYDPFGRRLWKEVNGVRTYFVYADEGLVVEVDAAGNVTKSYGYRPNSTWTTDPLFMKVDGQYYFYQNDHLGTPQKLTAVNGAVVWSTKYSSFGKAEVDPSSTITNNLRFPGQYYDQETGLHNNYHRYFDPKVGRYHKIDPIGLNGGINLYAYVSNSPTIYIDPLGLKLYGTLTGTFTGSFARYFSAEVGTFFVVDPCDPEYIYSFVYVGGGIGFGKGVAATFEVGVLETNVSPDAEDPFGITGFGWANNFYAAEGLKGISLQGWGNGKTEGNATGYNIGYAIGKGWGISGMLTHTWSDGKFKISELPQELQEVLGKTLPLMAKFLCEEKQNEQCESLNKQ